MTVLLETIARHIGVDVPAGAEGVVITGVAALETAAPGELTFLSNPKYMRYLAETKAAAVILPKGVEAPSGTVALVLDDPYFAFLLVLSLFDTRSTRSIAEGIHPTAVIAPDAVIGEDVAVGPSVVIGAGVKVGAQSVIGACTVIMDGSSVGAGCRIYPNVTIMDGCTVGDRVILHAGVVIGADGFGFAPHNGSLYKIPQIGSVRIGDDVEIGACSCIDRAAFGETVIERGVKIDNLVQVAHNVRIGQWTVVASQAGISGSTHIGAGVRIGGQAGLAGHLTVGDGSAIGAQGGVTKDVAPGDTVSGYPARSHREELRREAEIGRLSELRQLTKQHEARIRELERRLEER